MDDLQRIEGKTIQSIEQNTDGMNSYFIIKFEEGGKVNILSYPNGDEGVGELDVELGGIKEEDLIGKRIHSVTEKFDGANDYIVIKFKDQSEMTITSFCSIPDSTAGLDYTVYSSENLVAESVDYYFNENTYSDARKGQYPMHKIHFENSGDEPVQDEDEEDE